MSRVAHLRTTRRLAELVAIETPSGDAARLGEAYELIAGWGGEALGREPEYVIRAGVPHLLWRATMDPQLLIICHADTVFPAGTIDERPFRIVGDHATGPGVFDMKSGIVVALEALCSVRNSEHISLLITGDEETGSITSRPLIEDIASVCDATLVLEPSLDGAAKVGRKGGSFYSIRFCGKAAHAGLEPELGCNALIEMARWAIRLPGLARLDLGTTVTPTVADAGSAMNVVPAKAMLKVDVRARTLAELERVDTELRALSEDVTHGVTTSVDGGINRPPLEPGGSKALVELYEREAQRLGLSLPAAVTVGGASDGNFTAALGIPTLDGLGPSGGGAHAGHEWVDLADLDRRVPLMTALFDALIRRADRSTTRC